MTNNHESSWQHCLQIIKRNISDKSYDTWFEPIKPVRLHEAVLTIQVPNKFFYEWLEENFVLVLKKAIRTVLGEKGRLEYQILVDNHRKIGKLEDIKDDKVPGTFKTERIKNPFVIPGIQKMKIDPRINPKYLLSNFIEGDCNKLARSAGVAISKKPGGVFNPLFLYGDVGLGKTHLAQAIGNEVIKNHEDKNVLYVTSEGFTNQVVQSIKNNSVNDFMNFYQMIDVLIVDDIQFLANRTKTQEIFFNIFNILHQNGKQIIMTSDCPPKDLKDVEERLTSRFKWGLSADLKSPEFETRLAILESKMTKEGVEIPNEVSEFISFNVKNNIRELEGVMVSLIAQASLTDREIDLELAKEVIKQFVTQINKEITVENIAKMVADHYELPLEKLRGKTRKRSIVIARQLSMYFAKNMTSNSLKLIGDNFGGRDHTTVLHSLKAVQNMMDTNMLFKDEVEELEKKLQMTLHS